MEPGFRNDKRQCVPADECGGRWGEGGSHSLGIIEIRIKFFVLGALKCWDHSSAVN